LDLSGRYKKYIDCLNSRNLADLGSYVHEDVTYNGKQVGLDGYRSMLAGNYEDIPDLQFHIELLVSQSPYVGAVLRFDCHPKSKFLGLEINGNRAIFNENVFYRFDEAKIQEVWSVIDKTGLEKMFRTAGQ